MLWSKAIGAGGALNKEGWNISTAVFLQEKTAPPGSTSPGPAGLYFKPDGTKMYFTGSITNLLYEYNLSTAWNISTATLIRSIPIPADPLGLFFRPDGTKMYVIGNVNDRVYEYNLSTAWDISTAVQIQSFFTGSQTATPTGLFFKPDGSKMYFVSFGTTLAYEYNLGTPWNVTTAVFLRSRTLAGQDSSPRAIFFKPDGTKMYVIGLGNDRVYEYDIGTAWDISTAVFLRFFSIAAQGGLPTGLFFKSDGTKMYFADYQENRVFEYDLTA